MARKKVDKKGNETKKRIWLIINFAMIMAFGVLIAIYSETIGIAYVGSKSIVDSEAEKLTFNLTRDILIEANTVVNRNMGITVGIYAATQFLNYVIYLFKKKKVLFFLMLIELVGAITGYFINGELTMFIVPCLSGLIYFRVLNLEEV